MLVDLCWLLFLLWFLRRWWSSLINDFIKKKNTRFSSSLDFVSFARSTITKEKKKKKKKKQSLQGFEYSYNSMKWEYRKKSKNKTKQAFVHDHLTFCNSTFPYVTFRHLWHYKGLSNIFSERLITFIEQGYMSKWARWNFFPFLVLVFLHFTWLCPWRSNRFSYQ